MFELLTSDESLRMNALESIISKGKQTFVEVGTALAEIRDSKYYRRGFKTFGEYCQSKWGFEKAHAHRLIEAAAVVKTSPIGDKIKTEGQARELSKVSPPDRVAVIEKAQAAAEFKGRQMTAKDIKEASVPAAAPVEVLDEPAHPPETEEEEEIDFAAVSTMKGIWEEMNSKSRERFTDIVGLT